MKLTANGWRQYKKKSHCPAEANTVMIV